MTTNDSTTNDKRVRERRCFAASSLRARHPNWSDEAVERALDLAAMLDETLTTVYDQQ